MVITRKINSNKRHSDAFVPALHAFGGGFCCCADGTPLAAPSSTSLCFPAISRCRGFSCVPSAAKEDDDGGNGISVDVDDGIGSALVRDQRPHSWRRHVHGKKNSSVSYRVERVGFRLRGVESTFL